MSKTIEQKVIFKNTTPSILYALYMEAKQHAMITGAPAVISKKAGSVFSAHGGYCSGETLHVVKDEMIVQTWRAEDWDKSDPDSVLVLRFEVKGKDVVLYMVQALVPDKVAKGLTTGWHDFYWTPWKQHIAGKPITRAQM